MNDRSGNLSPAWIDRLERDADRFIADRAVPGLFMIPVVMVAFTSLTGSDSPFWKPAVWMTIAGLLLAVPRIWLTIKSKRLPETAAALPWRRAFAIITLVNVTLCAVYVALGVCTGGTGLVPAVMLFVSTTILAGSMSVYAPRLTLVRTIAAILFFIPLIGTLLMDTTDKYVLSTLTSVQAIYAIVQGKKLHLEYWQLAHARARLGQRNGDMRVVLDNIDQAVLTIDADGVLASERSATADRWFGGYDGRVTLVDHLAAVDPGFAESFALGHEALTENVFPSDVVIAQLPSRLTRGDRHYRCTYQPLPSEDGREGSLLVVINDVTEAVRRAQEELLQKEVLAVAQGLMADRAGYLAFFEEGKELMTELEDAGADQTTRARALHTLKGNAAMVGAEALAAQCHEAELDHEEGGEMSPASMARVRDRWNAIASSITTIIGTRSVGVVEIDPAVIDALTERVLSDATPAEVASTLAQWKLELAERALDRLAHYAAPLAKRLAKGELVTSVSAAGLRLSPRRWGPLWAVMVHVVRNAVDHGIESPEERAAAGKSPRPSLALRAREVDQELVVEIADDGRGIDWSRVGRRAEERGMPHATRADLLHALLDPGFTTLDEVTVTSGRGVGMAAVDEEVRKLGGAVALESEPGKGTTWRFTFPLPAALTTRSLRPPPRLASARSA